MTPEMVALFEQWENRTIGDDEFLRLLSEMTDIPVEDLPASLADLARLTNPDTNQPFFTRPIPQVGDAQAGQLAQDGLALPAPDVVSQPTPDLQNIAGATVNRNTVSFPEPGAGDLPLGPATFFETEGARAPGRRGVFNSFVANEFSNFSLPQQARIGTRFQGANARFALSDPETRGTFRDVLGTNPQPLNRAGFDTLLQGIAPFLNNPDPNSERLATFNLNSPERLISGIVGSGVPADQRRFVEEGVRNRVARFRDTNPEATTQEILREFVRRGGTLRGGTSR